MKIYNKKIVISLMLTFWGSVSARLPVLVSLGRNCAVALQLRAFELRSQAYPFDWLIAGDFEGVCRIFENKFEDFLNPIYLKLDGVNVQNVYYNIKFRHDFPTIKQKFIVNDEKDEIGYRGDEVVVENFLDYVGSVQDKYNRRIDRLLNLLQGSEKIVFIRTSITPEDANHFVLMMSKYYPQADYSLVVVHGNKKNNFNWGIPRVSNFYIKTKNPDQWQVNAGWFSAQEWKKIFVKLGFVTSNKIIIEESCDRYSLPVAFNK